MNFLSIEMFNFYLNYLHKLIEMPLFNWENYLDCLIGANQNAFLAYIVAAINWNFSVRGHHQYSYFHCPWRVCIFDSNQSLDPSAPASVPWLYSCSCCSFVLWHFIIPIRVFSFALFRAHASLQAFPQSIVPIGENSPVAFILDSFPLFSFFLIFPLVFLTPIPADDCSEFTALDCVLTFIHRELSLLSWSSWLSWLPC